MFKILISQFILLQYLFYLI